MVIFNGVPRGKYPYILDDMYFYEYPNCKESTIQKMNRKLARDNSWYEYFGQKVGIL